MFTICQGYFGSVTPADAAISSGDGWRHPSSDEEIPDKDNDASKQIEEHFMVLRKQVQLEQSACGWNEVAGFSDVRKINGRVTDFGYDGDP
jgi:hypothetical protein